MPLYGNNRFDNIENVIINKSRITLHPIGLKKRFQFNNSPLSVNIGATLVNRIYLGGNDVLERDYEFVNHDWFDVSYEIETFYNEQKNSGDGITVPELYINWNLDYNLQFNYDISPRFQANLGFNYSRNNIFFYNYSYSLRFYYNNSPTPNGSGGQGPLTGSFDPKYGVEDHFFYLNTGLTYRFQKKENKKVKN